MKIVSAANAMIANPKRISSVIPARDPSSTELFFKYADKYNWSVSQKFDSSDYFLFYYPPNYALEDLASMDEYQWQNFSDMVRYTASEVGGREAMQTFAELYQLVKGRVLGMDDVLDEIIDTADWAETNEF